MKFFTDKCCFGGNGSQDFLIFQAVYSTVLADINDVIIECESKELLNEKIKPPVTPNKIAFLQNWGELIVQKQNFKVSCLKQGKRTLTSVNLVSFFIAYELDAWSYNVNASFTLNNCFSGAVKLTENVNRDKSS